MAEILGIAPPTPAESTSVSRTTSAMGSRAASNPPSPGATPGMLVGTRSEPLEVSPPNPEGFPAVPARKDAFTAFPTFAKASTSSLAATFDKPDKAETETGAESPRMGLGGGRAGLGAGTSGLASMFAKASTSSLAATFDDPPPAAVSNQDTATVEDQTPSSAAESEKKRLKREKKERKEAKRAKKEAKVAKKASKDKSSTSENGVVVETDQMETEADDQKLEVEEKRRKKEKKEAKRAKKAKLA